MLDSSKWKNGPGLCSLDPMNPRPEDVYIDEIARALAAICRYNGQLPGPKPIHYSVAQHCVLGAQAFLGWDMRQQAKEFLMHDAAEAYIGDMVRPLKRHIPSFVTIEENIQKAVMKRFGLRYPIPVVYKTMDDIMLVTESLTFFNEELVRKWGYDPDTALNYKIEPWDAEYAESTFLKMYRYLFE